MEQLTGQSRLRACGDILRYYWTMACLRWRSVPIGQRLALGLLIIILLILCPYAFFARRLTLESLGRQRDWMLQKALRSTLTLIEYDQKGFLRSCEDYAIWGEFQDAMRKGDHKWVWKNILDWVPTHFDLDGVLVLNQRGEPVYSVGVKDPEMVRNPLVQKSLQGISSTGWLSVSGRLYRVAGVPILGDEFAPPQVGVLLFIQEVDQRVLLDLSNRAGYHVLMTPSTGSQGAVGEAVPNQPVLQTDGEEGAVGTYLQDVSGRPGAFLKLKMPADHARIMRFAIGRVGLQLVLLGIAISLGSTLAILVLLRRMIQPFVVAANHLASGIWESRVAYPARDEFGLLARAFNQMAAELQFAFERLQAQREKIEHQKTELERLYQGLQQANEALKHVNLELLEANSRLEEAATTDGLTGLQNHRAFQEALLRHAHLAQRYHYPFSLILLDLDHFKKYNDSYGHPAGDELLKRVAAILQESARAADMVARYGGEEFAILLPNTDLEAAIVVAERIRKRIGETPFEHGRVTASLGVACMTGEQVVPGILLYRADQALYKAKRTGRNRVCVAEDIPRKLAG